MGINYAVLGINCYKKFLILPRTTVLRRSKYAILGKLTNNNVHTDLSATACVAVTENTL